MLNSQLFSVFLNTYKRLETPLRHRFWRVLVLSSVVAVMEFVLTASVSLLGVILAAPQSLLQTPVVHRVLKNFPSLEPIAHDQRQLLVWLLASLCGVLICKSCALALLTWRQASFSQAVGLFFSESLFCRLLQAPYLWHVQQHVSTLQTKLTWSLATTQFMMAVHQALGQIVIMFVLLGVVFAAAPFVALLVCACTGGCAVLTYRLTRHKVRQLSSTAAQAEIAASKVTYPALYGIREVKIYRQEQPFLREYLSSRREYAAAHSLLPVVSPLPSWVLEFVGMGILFMAVLYMNAQNVPFARLTGTVTLLAAVAWRLLPCMNRVVSYLLQLQQSLAHVQGMLSLLDSLTFRDGMVQSTSEPCPLHDALELREVSFRYPGCASDKTDALRHISLRIPRGGMIGLIGPSGAGKSTVVGLLTGLLEPTSGALLVDGQILTSARRGGWQSSIGYVPQTPFLLNASIAENVAFSQWGGKIDRERVLRCCRMAAMDFLDELPEGMDTVIGERGVRLSGGQVQRVAIARALYEEPQMILFDEATSALDGASEQAIQNTINSLSGQVTMVVVAHRLTTVEKCDYIYWIQDGRMNKRGSPDIVLPEYEEFLKKRSVQINSEG